MKKQAKDIKSGEKIVIAGQTFSVKDIEISDIGKHGKRKCRIEAVNEKEEKIVIIRPEDYVFETSE